MHLLEGSGYRVIVARNGEEGLAAARARLPALILSDVEMPILTGYQMCRALKDDPRLGRIPVILLTSLSDPADVVRGLQAGADYYLTKPCEGQFLLERVAAVLDAPPALDPSGATTETIEVTIEGEHHVIAAGSRQILNLLLSTYANAVQRNRELVGAERRLSEQNKLLQEAARAEHQAHEALKSAQAQLVQNEKLASLGQLVAGVAHEINNPLSFVMNNVTILQRNFIALCELLQLYKGAAEKLDPASDLAGAIKEHCERIDLPYTLSNLAEVLERSRVGLRRIKQIVADLRDFARLDESGLKAVDLNAGIRTTANIMMTKAREKEIHLEMELGQMPMVTCYPAKINQVVLNLLDNAIDACPNGGKVTIQTAASGDRARIDVTDTGCGIDPAIQSRIFDPFFTTKPIGKGTGLGLSISYGIVNEHQGTIEVDSCPGRGSHFTVRLPIAGPLAAWCRGGFPRR